MIHPQEDKILI